MVDAKATKGSITLTSNSLTLEDNGCGIQTDNEIEKHFATVGQPHEESEQKVFGEFRMGRGQLFAYGHNTWRTGPFEITVDVKEAGLGYELIKHADLTEGMQIEISLYQELESWRVQSICNELHDKLAYTDIELTINGKTVESKPAEFWTTVTPEAKFSLQDTNEGLYIYNLGVFVCSVSAGRYGVAGTVVSTQRLKLNYARNEVQDDCPVWQEIEKTLKAVAGKSVMTKTRLTESERQAVRIRLGAGTMYLSDVAEKKILTLANGQTISFKDLARIAKSGRPIAVAEAGSVPADMAIRQGTAVVLAEHSLRDLGFMRYEMRKASEWLREQLDTPIAIQKLDDLDLSDNYRLLTPEDYLSHEKFWIKFAMNVNVSAACGRDERSILLGDSDAYAWTDGVTYIALTRKFLKTLERDFDGIFELGRVLLHEYCHDTTTSSRHDHTQEFYNLFHDLVESHFPSYLRHAARLLKSRSPKQGTLGLLNLIDS